MQDFESILLEVLVMSGCVWALINLGCILFIYFRFIRPLRINQKFVHFFYGLAGLLMCILMIKAIQDFMDLVDKDTDKPSGWQQFIIQLRNMANVILGYSMVCAMYKIAVSIEFVNGKITLKQQKGKKCCFYTFCTVMTILILIETIAYYFVRSNEASKVDLAKQLFCMIWYLSLSLVFGITLRKLLTELKQIDPVNQLDGFGDEKRKLICQLSIFSACYLIRAAQALGYLVFKQRGEKSQWRFMIYTAAITENLPVSYMLFVHYRAYQTISDHNKRVSTRHTTTREVHIRLSDFSVQEETENDQSVDAISPNRESEIRTTTRQVEDQSFSDKSQKRTLQGTTGSQNFGDITERLTTGAQLERSSEIRDFSKTPNVKAPEDEPLLSGLSSEHKASTIYAIQRQTKASQAQKSKRLPSFLLGSLLMIESPNLPKKSARKVQNHTSENKILESYEKQKDSKAFTRGKPLS